MQTLQWTLEVIIIASIVGLLGFLLARVVFLQNRRKQLDSALQKKNLVESQLRTQLENAQSTERRLQIELVEAKKKSTEQGNLLEQTRLQHHETETQLEVTQANFRSQREQLQRANQQLENELEHYTQLQEKYQALSGKHTELATRLKGREEHFKEQIKQLGETRQSLTKEFENLANKIFEEKGKTFTHVSQTGIQNLLKPFQAQIEGFQKRVNEVHDAATQGNSSLSAEIKKMLETGLQMSKEAHNLTLALKGGPQQRGAWGEAQLRRTLEMSGLIEAAHYDVQSSFKDAEGKQKQTDYLIKLPDGKHIIIDSKITLNAYDRTVAAESPEAYQLAINEHVKAVRKHIDDLASKDYTNLVGLHSPSFVLMFMPIEPAYIEALKHNKNLFEYGYKKNIILVSHTTLIPILRTVSNLWMIERSNSEAREISEKAGDIYNQICIMAEHLNKLGGTLKTVSNHYNGTVRALTGQRGLYGKIDRFKQLSVKVSKKLPQLEPADMDFETERLTLIAEPAQGGEAQ